MDADKPTEPTPDQDKGLLLPAIGWLLKGLYGLSLCNRLNERWEKRAWVSETYCLATFLLGITWLTLLELPVFTERGWIYVGEMGETGPALNLVFSSSRLPGFGLGPPE